MCFVTIEHEIDSYIKVVSMQLSKNFLSIVASLK